MRIRPEIDGVAEEAPDRPAELEELEGLDDKDTSWGDYPLDEVLIRNESRTIYDVVRRIRKGQYVMDPDFQRDFIWPEDKQSKLIESVVMRIPLPVFYLAENDAGKMVVVDGLQRLSTFLRFVNGELKLRLADRAELNDKTFEGLEPKLQTRIEDCNLIFYVIDSKVPERARLDIFERVNGGVPLSRQQMRNSLFMGPATRFLKREAKPRFFCKRPDAASIRRPCGIGNSSIGSAHFSSSTWNDTGATWMTSWPPACAA